MSVTIRHSEQQDIAAIKAIYEQPQNYSATLQLPFPSLDKWQQNLGTPSNNFYSLVAELNGEIVGQIGIDHFANPRRRHVANIGMAVLANHQGKGVGSALLKGAIELCNNWLAVSRIELEVYTDNTAAINLYKKFGFNTEGTAKNYAFRHGEYVDVLLMAKA
ncbi:GNAT family N-acetyltransferase [Paraferrimonas sp. SM1919]|uniref:GNAT family N-acetyltransferase n=1 Tax=Paraferrimonas sp. SM1919 TaxID=2662263 RepID=UPI0013D19A09|nr:GNAT family N-acetyltransferase [Paraferrimonas sp. SM1919]